MNRLAELEERMARLETATTLTGRDVGYREIRSLVQRVDAFTREIFGGDATYCEREDDELLASIGIELPVRPECRTIIT